MDNWDKNQDKGDDPMIGKLIFDRYTLKRRLGAGSFGCIYSAEYDGQLFAIKLEDKNCEQNLLENEAYIMSYLHCPGLPLVKSYGYSSKYNILVMELMGKSLEDIFENLIIKKMSSRCVCNIGYQMIEILEFIHNKHIIHRDIKPDNFVVGRNTKKKYIYLLDFGLSKKYRSSRNLKHYPIEKGRNLTGTARYASINALDGYTQSRRDDLESVGYVLMYFLRGRLPWQGIQVKNKEDRYRKIMEKKIATSAEELCKGFPKQFEDYVNYSKKLQYEEDPDYNYLKNLFVSCLKEENFKIDCYYDWDKETINYFRDYKNIDKNKNKTQKNENIQNIQTIETKDINQKDVNIYKPILKNKNTNPKSSGIDIKYQQITNISTKNVYNPNGTFHSTVNHNEQSTFFKKTNEVEEEKNNTVVNNYLKEKNNENNDKENINNNTDVVNKIEENQKNDENIIQKEEEKKEEENREENRNHLAELKAKNKEEKINKCCCLLF